ncbi:MULTISPECIES: hypothetical protein [Shewanella]|uniref:hypothetical protein n=1 Tax=Shewanella TaxID=22 RepID=UPI001BBE002C|nr:MULTISPECIES: hypothetical protein [Shewanella]GIU52399.1 hypothetical protein TUM4249_21970 [Shewanella sp. KT0246]
MKRILAVLLSGSLLACSHQTAVQNTHAEVKPPKIQCGATPPLLDTQGIRDNLLERGDITLDMTEAEQQAVVNEYIAKRNNAYKKCKQGK